MTERQDELRVSVRQTAPALGDVAANRAAIEREVREAAGSTDVLVYPELALTGYSLGHRARELGVDLTARPPLALPADGPAAVLGLVERGEDRLTYNAGLAVRGPDILAVHRKLYLPTYGTFDEGRLFAAGRRSPRPFTLAPGWRAGILVCEDFWHPSLAYLYALQEVDVLLAIAAAPGRGETRADRRFSSTERWELIARTTAMVNGVYLILCNRVGVEAGLTFAGGSLVVDPRGTVIGRAPEAEPACLDVVLERDRVTDARHPFALLRDEDPALTLHTLERILRER